MKFYFTFPGDKTYGAYYYIVYDVTKVKAIQFVKKIFGPDREIMCYDEEAWKKTNLNKAGMYSYTEMTSRDFRDAEFIKLLEYQQS